MAKSAYYSESLDIKGLSAGQAPVGMRQVCGFNAGPADPGAVFL